MAILALMASDESEGSDRPDADSGGRDGDERRASDDLAEGLELMLRAARKAVRDIDTGRIEELGRRARKSLENVNPKTVEEFGRKAAEKLDPRRMEEIANEAGRELINVVERVADRVDRAVAGSGPRRPRTTDDDAQGTSDSEEASDVDDPPDDKPPRVRVED